MIFKVIFGIILTIAPFVTSVSYETSHVLSYDAAQDTYNMDRRLFDTLQLQAEASLNLDLSPAKYVILLNRQSDQTAHMSDVSIGLVEVSGYPTGITTVSKKRLSQRIPINGHQYKGMIFVAIVNHFVTDTINDLYGTLNYNIKYFRCLGEAETYYSTLSGVHKLINRGAALTSEVNTSDLDGFMSSLSNFDLVLLFEGKIGIVTENKISMSIPLVK